MNLNEWEKALISRYGKEMYHKISNSSVAVAGLGGMGSNVALLLARLGIGRIHLIDFDVVDCSNINRQAYSLSCIGKSKTTAIEKMIREVNSFIKIEIDNIKVIDENLREIFSKDKIICECFDNADAKAMLVNGILENFPNSKIVACSGIAGFDSANNILTRKITDNFYICGDEKSEVSNRMSLMPPRVAVCAGHQANMVLKIILNEV